MPSTPCSTIPNFVPRSRRVKANSIPRPANRCKNSSRRPPACVRRSPTARRPSCAGGSMRIGALFFDVFGTLVDWRTSIAREAEEILKPLGHSLDWLAFADAWRGEYQPAMEEIRSGRLAFCKLDVLHRRNLEKILPRFKIAGLPETTMRHLNLAWHRLDAWPDSAAGLAR